MDLTERTIESKTMFQGRIITVLLDTAGLPDGGTAQREVVLHPGGVAVLALDEADNVALVRQYRYPLHGLLLELPAGKLDPGEDHRPAARMARHTSKPFFLGSIRSSSTRSGSCSRASWSPASPS